VNRSTILIIILFQLEIALADSSSQTEWWGGPGVWGPISNWNTQFYQMCDVDWSLYSEHIQLQSNSRHTVDILFDGAISVYSEDIDGDGDMDVLGAACFADDITWWENSEADTGSGIYWIRHIIDGDFDYARSVHSEDVDNDGDMDVIGAAWDDSVIVWWENEDGSLGVLQLPT